MALKALLLAPHHRGRVSRVDRCSSRWSPSLQRGQTSVDPTGGRKPMGFEPWNYHHFTSLWSWECARFQAVFHGVMPGYVAWAASKFFQCQSMIFQITFPYPSAFSYVRPSCAWCWGPFLSRTSTPPFQTVAEIAVTATFFHRKIERTKDACVRFITETVRQNKNVAKQWSWVGSGERRQESHGIIGIWFATNKVRMMELGWGNLDELEVWSFSNKEKPLCFRKGPHRWFHSTFLYKSLISQTPIVA